MLRILLIVVAVVLAGWLALSWVTDELARPLPAHAFWSGVAPRVIAHRGGSGLWPENTLYAFRHSLALGADVVEMDLRRSADGELVVLHDESVERTTDGVGAVSALTLAQLKRLDAGYRWTRNGKTFPYRSRGITVPTLDEVLLALPGRRFNLEIKPGYPGMAWKLCDLIRRYGVQLEVAVASLDQGEMDAFRAACPNVATAATANEVMRFIRLRALLLGALFEPRAQVFQVPERVGDYAVVTAAFARAARGRNIKVEVWTVDETEAMRRLLAFQVDGIMTNYPDRLLALLGRLGPEARGAAAR